MSTVKSVLNEIEQYNYMSSLINDKDILPKYRRAYELYQQELKKIMEAEVAGILSSDDDSEPWCCQCESKKSISSCEGDDDCNKWCYYTE